MSSSLGTAPAPGSRVLVIGAGPAGLMAAEVLQAAGAQVQVLDAMPSAGRKLLRAGIGGLNLTHAEPYERFITRYFERQPQCTQWLDAWGPQALRDWAEGLGIATFVGSSQRVFPVDMKAAPLLRAWLKRLQSSAQGVPVQFHMRHRWTGGLQQAAPGVWRVAVQTPQGACEIEANAVVLALGGGSWAKLGSDGAWVPTLAAAGVEIAPLQPANCGFDVKTPSGTGTGMGWSGYFRSRFAGTPLKALVLSHTSGAAPPFSRKGELVITQTGLEGSLVYAASKALRQTIGQEGCATLHLDLKPDWDVARLTAVLAQPRGKRSLSHVLQGKVGLAPVHTALLHEVLPKEAFSQAPAHPSALAQAIKHLPITLVAPRPIDEAISTAGGVKLEALGLDLMIKSLPGVFVAGEMLDWEAPTGGYLLTACMASGRMAGRGVQAYLQGQHP